MQEWIIAMLVISITMILRDMAKTIFKGKNRCTQGFLPCKEEHPQREKIVKYAESFQKLADTFYTLPYRTEYLRNGQVQRIVLNIKENVCAKCYQREICWIERQKEMTHACEGFIRIIEEGDEEKFQRVRNDWVSMCTKAALFFETMFEGVKKEQTNLVWDNRLIENRFAVAGQLTEVSSILRQAAEDLYDLQSVSYQFLCDMRKKLKAYHIVIKNIWMMDKKEGHRQLFMELRVRSGQCVSISEISQAVSSVCGTQMIPAMKGRCMINGEFHMIQLVEDMSYQIMYGIAKLTNEKEKISGDNYICKEECDGRFIMCLSDGMGSGIDACRESEIVVELLEQFMESGFSQETAVKMVNSALLIKSTDEIFSTIDLCAVDLYTGICSFLKAGAASTFIKRDHWVETITSESLAAGILQNIDFEMAARKLYHGDYVIMMTDGVMDALPREKEEEIMKEIIMDVKESTPREIGRGILERVLGYSDYHVQDDMTVLVAGMWRK